MFYLLGVIIGLVISFLITALLIWILAMCFLVSCSLGNWHWESGLSI